jgi:hypothetical protein
MVKGVTKRIVEIKETGSSYFERAIFFVSMEGRRGANEYTLSQEARRIIDRLSNDKSLQMPGQRQGKRALLFSLIKLVGSAAFGTNLSASSRDNLLSTLNSEIVMRLS